MMVLRLCVRCSLLFTLPVAPLGQIKDYYYYSMLSFCKSIDVDIDIDIDIGIGISITIFGFTWYWLGVEVEVEEIISIVRRS